MRFYKVETPHTILNWNRETFGERANAVLGARTLMEVAEFIHAVSINDTQSIIEELADVAIMMWTMAALCNSDARPKLDELDLEELRDLNCMHCTMQLGNHYMKYLERHNKKGGADASKHLSSSLKSLEMLARVLNVDLCELVDQKMVVNRQRVWTRLANGVDQHVS